MDWEAGLFGVARAWGVIAIVVLFIALVEFSIEKFGVRGALGCGAIAFTAGMFFLSADRTP